MEHLDLNTVQPDDGDENGNGKRHDLANSTIKDVWRHILEPDHRRQLLSVGGAVLLAQKLSGRIWRMMNPGAQEGAVVPASLMRGDKYVAYQLFRAKDEDAAFMSKTGGFAYFDSSLDLVVEPVFQRKVEVDRYVQTRYRQNRSTVAGVDGPTYRPMQISRIRREHPTYANYLESQVPDIIEAEVPSDWLMIDGVEMVQQRWSEDYPRGVFYMPPDGGSAMILSDRTVAQMRAEGHLQQGILWGSPGYLSFDTTPEEIDAISDSIGTKISTISAFAELRGDEQQLVGYVYLQMQLLSLHEFHKVLKEFSESILKKGKNTQMQMHAAICELEGSSATVIHNGEPAVIGLDNYKTAHGRTFQLVLQDATS